VTLRSRPVAPVAPASTAGEAGAALERTLFEVKKVVVGQDRMVERIVVALLSRGHCLLEGVPGVAKSLAVETLARVVGGSSVRLQFTPDLVPSDIVGTRIYRPSREDFDTELGPVFANLVLADEINRAPAKVQSALLEVMAERQVSIGGTTYPLPVPFSVLATQNPLESEGVYPLPEAQRDRFLLRVVVGHPSMAEEREIVRRMTAHRPRAEQVVGSASWWPCRSSWTASSSTTRSRSTSSAWSWRPANPPPGGLEDLAPYLAVGASPRGSLGLVQAAKALAVLHGRDYVLPVGRARPRRRRPCAPARAHLRGARRGRAGRRRGPPGRRRRPGAHRGAGARGRRRGRMTAVPLAPAAAVRRLHLDVGRRLDGLLQGEHPRAAARSWPGARGGAAVRAGRRRAPHRLGGDRPHR
jgi:MoxR-like ATPase